MISGNKKLRFIRCNESELTEENSKYPVTEGYVYICEDTENIYFDDSDNKRHLVNGKLLNNEKTEHSDAMTFIINEMLKQNIEYKNLLNSINGIQNAFAPIYDKINFFRFDSVDDLLDDSIEHKIDYSSMEFTEIPYIKIINVNMEEWAKPYYRYTSVEDITNETAKLVFKFDENIKNEKDKGSIKIDVNCTLTTSETTTNIYSPGNGIVINENDKSISLSDSGVTPNTYGPDQNNDVTGSDNTAILIPKITVDEYGRVTDVVNIKYISKDTTYNAVTSVAGKTGDVGLTKSDVGLDQVENKSSATIRGELTDTDVTNALGYTPPRTDTDTTYSDATTSHSGLMSASDKSKINLIKTESDLLYDSSGTDYVISGWRIAGNKLFSGLAGSNRAATIQSAESESGAYVFAAGSQSHSAASSGDDDDYYGNHTGYSNATFRVKDTGETWIDNGHGTISASSDRKLKDHIEYLSEDDKLQEFFDGLKPIMFIYKNAKAKRHHMGFYAQDVSENAKNTIGDIAACKANIFKEVNKSDAKYIEEYFDPNTDDEDLRWYLDYIELIAPTVAVVQKQSAKIKELENTVEELKSVVEELKSLLE